MAIGFPKRDNYTRPPGRRSFTGADGYASGEAYRADLRGDGARGIPDGGAGHESNPVTHSKATRHYGRQGSKLKDVPYKSTGEQPATVHGDPPSMAPVYHRQQGQMQPKQVGYPGGGAPFVRAQHPNTHKSDPTTIHRTADTRRPGAESREALAARAKNAKPTQQVPDTTKLNRR